MPRTSAPEATGVQASASRPRRASIGARRDPRAEAAILDSARMLLAEKGYAGFSIEEVARRAGAGKPTIYRWWPTRADLFIDVYSQEKSTLMLVPDTGILTDDLVAYTRALWAFWRDTPSGRTFRALVAEAQASATALSALRDRFLPKRLKDVRQMFERAAARGEIAHRDLDTRVTLYIGFNWVRLLTDSIADDPDGIAEVMHFLAARN